MPLKSGPARGVRVRMLGDHSAVHGGCEAVWSVMRREARRQGAEIVGPDEAYDSLVVNGEGSMHHDGKTHQAKMRALAEAVEAGKPAWLINTVWQDNSHEYDGVLQGLQGVVAREGRSQAALRAHGVEATVKPDLSWFRPPGEARKFRDFHRSIAITDFYCEGFDHFVRPSAGPLSRRAYFNFQGFDWDGAIETLKTIRLLITGRQHAVYACCKARTPFLAVRGNSHKIEGLIEMAGANIPVLDRPLDALDAVGEAMANAAEYERLFDWLEAQSIDGAFPDLTAPRPVAVRARA